MRAQAWVRRLLVAAGVAMIAFALFGGGASSLLMSPYLRFVVVVTLVVLVLLLPVAMAAGWLIGKLVPVVARPVVQGAFIATALIVGIALPSVLGRGRESVLPSALPRNYASGLWGVLAVVWGGALALIVLRIARRRSNRSKPNATSSSKPAGTAAPEEH